MLTKFEALQAVLSEEHNRITHEVNSLIQAARRAKKRNPPEPSRETLIIMLETIQDYLVDEYYRIDNEGELLAEARVKIAEECERQVELKARTEGIMRKESGNQGVVVDHMHVQRFNSLNPRCAITFHKLANKWFGAGHSEQQFEIELHSYELSRHSRGISGKVTIELVEVSAIGLGKRCQ